MDNRDQSQGAVNNLVRILKRLTRIVQIAPFVYLFFLSVYMLSESVLPEWAARLFDNLLDAPLYTTIGMLGIGRLLKLCEWFRTACLLPFTTKVGNYIDSFVYTFSQNEIVILHTVLSLLFLSFIYLTFRHFFHGREENPHRNP